MSRRRIGARRDMISRVLLSDNALDRERTVHTPGSVNVTQRSSCRQQRHQTNRAGLHRRLVRRECRAHGARAPSGAGQAHVNVDPRNGRNSLGQQSAMTLVLNTRKGGGKETPAAQQRKDVRILDIVGNTASVRLDAGPWVDSMHVAKGNGRWVIVNVLWELRQ